MPDPPNLPAPEPESRVDRIERIVLALSDFEQDELRAKLGALQLQQQAARLADKRNLVALGVHNGLFCGIFFGFFMGLAAAFVAGSQAGALAAIGTFFTTFFVSGGIFGVFMGAYIALLMGVFVPRMTKNYANQRSALFQMESVDLDVDPATAYKVCKESALSKRGWKADTIDDQNLSLQLLSPFTFRSPGELVGIRVESTATGSRVKIFSKAIYSAMDFGKNRKNVVDLAKSIQLNAETHKLLLPGP